MILALVLAAFLGQETAEGDVGAKVLEFARSRRGGR